MKLSVVVYMVEEPISWNSIDILMISCSKKDVPSSILREFDVRLAAEVLAWSWPIGQGLVRLKCHISKLSTEWLYTNVIRLKGVF